MTTKLFAVARCVLLAGPVLGKHGQRLLKVMHVTSAGVWLGCLFAIVVLLLVGDLAPTSHARFGLDLGAHVIHDDVLLWAFIVTLATGFAFAVLTPWGAIRHHWITTKWLLAFALFAITLWFQNPALAIVAGLSDAGAEGVGSLRYTAAHRAALGIAVGQLAIVLLIFTVSTLKPWGQRTRDLPRKLVVGLATAGLAIGATFGLFNYRRLEHIRNLPIENVAIAAHADGTWRGEVSDCGLPYSVEVSTAGGRITRIAVVTSGTNRYAELGAAVLPRIVKMQTPDVDAITGATTTSHCLSRAVARALL